MDYPSFSVFKVRLAKRAEASRFQSSLVGIVALHGVIDAIAEYAVLLTLHTITKHLKFLLIMDRDFGGELLPAAHKDQHPADLVISLNQIVVVQHLPCCLVRDKVTRFEDIKVAERSEE